MEKQNTKQKKEIAEQEIKETQKRALKVEKQEETPEQVVEETEEKEKKPIEVGEPEQEY